MAITTFGGPQQLLYMSQKSITFIICYLLFLLYSYNLIVLRYFILQKIMNVGTVPNLVQYLSLNKHILQKQRSNLEHMQRIMSMLSHENMQILERQFELYPKGLELPTFIYLMKRLYTPENQLSKYYFVSDLIKFFQAIDINGDGHLEWSEFTEYIIENIRRIDKPNYKNKVFQENEVISSAYSKISNQYRIASVVDPGTVNCVKKIVSVVRDQRYYLLEAGSNIIRIYDQTFALIDYLQLHTDNMHSFIVDFAFDKENNVFGALFQGGVRFCNLKVLGNVKTCNECESKKLVSFHKIEYLPIHKYWAFLSKTGEVRLSTAVYRSRTILDYTSVLVLRQHEALITDIVEIQEPLYIGTSSMDGNVKFYSVYLKKNLTMESGGQKTVSAINSRYKKGVLGIDYTRQFGNYMLSWGFSSAILVYSLEISLTKGFTGKYKEHSGNLLAARFLRSFPYVLSFDDRLSMRIWDFRKFVTVQVINCQKNFINPSRLEIIPELSQCLVCEKKITQFRAPSLEKKSRQINEFHSIFDFRVCSATNSIFLFTSNDVRVYSLVTGTIEKVFTKLNENSHDTHITAAEFGYKCRKFFIGDAAGFVREYCSQTGDFLQEVDPGEQNQCENKSIVRIIFLKEHSLLIVCSLDGRILIYERDSESEFQLIRDIRDTHFELTTAQASARYCILATGSEDGTVNIWNLQKLSLQGVLVMKSKIINIAFSPIHPIMIVAEQSGVISFFFIRPHEDPATRNKCFVKLVNLDILGRPRKLKSINFQLIIRAYIKSNNPLVEGSDEDQHLICILGTEQGYIQLVNITELLETFKIEQNHQIFTIKKSLKCQTHNFRSAVNAERKKVLTIGYSNDGVKQLDLNDFTKRTSFEAHKEGVERVALIKQNSMVISTSNQDKKVKVWNLEGDLTGAIDFFTFKKISWKIGQINFYKVLQAIDTTIYSMKLIQNKQLSAQQQQFIRVNLLLNEYMDPHEKQQYLSWVGVLKRTRGGRPRQRVKPKLVMEEDQYDVREEIEKLGPANGRKENDQEENVAEFNQIYNKLITKIRDRIDRTELPTISKKDSREEKIERVKEKEIGFNDFVATLKKTLRGGQEEEKKYEKQFRAVMNRSGKSKKKSCKMLYQSLSEVRRNIQAMEKKTQHKIRKVL